jgi:hypothetical protein
MTASEKVHMLRLASPVVVAVYAKVRLTPPGSRALPLALFAKPLRTDGISNMIAGKLQ